MSKNGAVQRGQNREKLEETKMRTQMARQSSILIGDDTCRRNVAEALGVDPSNLDTEELLSAIDEFLLRYKLDTQFYDSKFLETLGCVMKLGLTANQRMIASGFVREFFTHRRQIGAVSVEGIAMMTGVKGADNIFVMKAPRDPKRDYLIHEYFVAQGGVYRDSNGLPREVLGTNWLRNVCLNYAQVISAFQCGAPEINPLTKELGEWCSLKNPQAYVTYVTYEKINGKDLNAMAHRLSAETFISTMIQVAFALELGQMHNGFTHYDLHYENLIMRPCSGDLNNLEQYLVPFIMGSQTVYVKSSFVPTIIDFGRSHIQYPPPAEAYGHENEADHFGYRSAFAEEFGIFAEESRPFYDIFKLIGFTLYAMYDTKNPEFDRVWPIMGFFGLRTRDAVVAWLVKSRSSDLYSLPSRGEAAARNYCLQRDLSTGSVCMTEDTVNIYDFLYFIGVQFTNIWGSVVFQQVQSGIKVLQCTPSTCSLTTSDNLKSLIHSDAPADNLTYSMQHFNRSTGKGLNDFMIYRNNMNERALYFMLRPESSEHGNNLKESVMAIDKSFTPADYQTLETHFINSMVGLDSAFKRIGFPFQYNPDLKLSDQETMIKLNSFSRYLDAMAEWERAFVDVIKTFKNMKAIYSFVYSQDLDPAIESDLHSNLLQPMQVYSAGVEEINNQLYNMEVSPAHEQYRTSIWMRTLDGTQ